MSLSEVLMVLSRKFPSWWLCHILAVLGALKLYQNITDYVLKNVKGAICEVHHNYIKWIDNIPKVLHLKAMLDIC